METSYYSIVEWKIGREMYMKLPNEHIMFPTQELAEKKLAEWLIAHHERIIHECYESAKTLMLDYAFYNSKKAEILVPKFLEERYGVHPANKVWQKWYEANWEDSEIDWFDFPEKIKKYDYNGIYYQVVKVIVNDASEKNFIFIE